MSDPQLEAIARKLGLTVEGKLGQGGMGAVYRVIADGHPCALKVLTRSAVADESSLRRFIQEGRVLARLEHPNVIRLHALGEDPELPYLLCELIEGESLDQVVAREGALPWDRALGLADQVLAGLSAAHAIDVIHRDIKPSNVLLGSDGVAKVADFGIAKAEQVETKHTTTGMIVGTPAYIAPEVLRGEKATPRADVYSAGVLLYELLVGRLPWEHTEAGALLTERISMTEAPLPTRRNGALPKSLDALVGMALAPRPVDRYPTANVFRQAINHARKQLVQSVGNTASISQSTVRPRTVKTSVPLSRPGEPPPPPRLRVREEAPPARGVPLAVALLLFASVTVWAIARARTPGTRVQTTAAVQADLRGPDPTDAEQKLYQDLRLDGVQAAALREAVGSPRGVQLVYRAWRSTSGERKQALRDALALVEDPLAIPALVELVAASNVEAARREDAARRLRERLRATNVEPERFESREELATQLCDFLGREHATAPPALARAAIAALGWLRDPSTSQHCMKFMALAQSADPEGHKLLEQALKRFQSGKAREHAAAELRQLN